MKIHHSSWILLEFYPNLVRRTATPQTNRAQSMEERVQTQLLMSIDYRGSQSWSLLRPGAVIHRSKHLKTSLACPFLLHKLFLWINLQHFFVSQQKKHILWEVYIDKITLTHNNWENWVLKVSPTEYCCICYIYNTDWLKII